MHAKPLARCSGPALVLVIGLSCLSAVRDAHGADDSDGRAAADPLAPIALGSRDELGEASLGDKAAKSVLGALLGGSKGGGKRPKTRRDPTRKQDYTVQQGREADLEVGARSRWTDEGLLLSTAIESSGEKGTFHAIFLQDCAGRRLYPASVEIYKLWSDSSISVSWSRTSSVDGQVVSSESGGWSDSWSDDWSLPGSADAASDGPPGIWQQAGFDRAQGGIRAAGAYFSAAPEDLADCDPGAYVHVTRPGQDPVVTSAVAFTLQTKGLGGGGEGAVAVLAGHTAATVPPGVSGTLPPCEEALLRIEQKKTAMLAALDDPARLLQAALQAAADLGDATRAQGEAEAHAVAEQATLEGLETFLGAWDQWFEQRIEQREQRREDRYGSREPSWAKGSRQRAERRHEEDTAELREQVEEQRQRAEAARAAATAAAAARQAAQQRFDRALDEFERALAALRNAKDSFAELVVRHYRCSPCEAIAGHWQSAARLRALLDRLAAMLAQRQAAVTAALAQARSAAEDAAGAAQQARARHESLQQRRAEIEQEMRDAVDTSSGCLSLEPTEGSSWLNIASMDRTRGTVVPEGAAMAWRSRFKGSDVRVWSRPGCLQEQIEDIDWRKINELNSELHDLQLALDEAAREAIAAARAAGIAQAVADGLQAEADALDALARALRNSGLGDNVDEVLERLDELSEDCEQAMKDAIRGAADARKRHGDANGRITGATSKRDGLRRRAGAAADELDDMDPSVGSDEDRDRHGRLGGKADGLADGSGDGPGPAPVNRPPPPETLGEAEDQRDQAERDADAAEAEADALESEVDKLKGEVEDLEDDVDELGQRLRDWRDYHAALARYEDCLRKKQAAVEELAKLNRANASALEELAKRLGEAADSVGEASDALGDLGRVNERAKEASEKASELADVLDRLGNAMEILDAVMRRDDLRPSEKLEAMSKAFEELRQWLPELPGVSEMLEFYNEAMKAIAGKLAEIEDVQIKQWTDLVEAGIADPEDAPVGIREEVRKAARIRELMKIITRNCGRPPTPPATMVQGGP